MKMLWGKVRMFIVLAVARLFCVPVKVSETYLEENVFGLGSDQIL